MSGTSTRTLSVYPERLVVAKLGAGSEVPGWAESASVFAVIATATETTVVCAGRSVPKKVPQHGPFTAYAVEGPVDPEMSGLLHEMLAPLAEAGIGVRVVPAYATDWILVPTDQADAAAEAWRARGHTVAPAVPAENS